MNRANRRMTQDELAVLERHARLAMVSSRNQGCQKAVQERQRRDRGAVTQAVLESSAECGKALCMELRAAQPNNESAMEMVEREILVQKRKRRSSST